MFKQSLENLQSGLRLLKIPMKGVESVTVLVLVNTGSRYEDLKIQGIAHFFEHLVFKGTDQYPDPLALSSVVDSIGADFNAFTSKEYTGFYVKAASQHFKLALNVVSEMLLKPLLKEDDIEREKGVIIEELNMYVDNPSHHISNLFDRMFYRDGGLQHDIIGTKETISNVKKEDFLGFLRQWYGLSNMTLVIAGDEKLLNDPKSKTLVEECFPENPELRDSSRVHLDTYLSKMAIADKRLHLEHRETQQAHFVMGWPSISRQDGRKYVLNMLSIILGGNMSSRLFSEVREKRGLCYYINSDVDLYHDAGCFGASAGVDLKRVEEAIKVVAAQFTDLATGNSLVTAEELKKAKDYLLGKMVLSFEDSQSVAQFFGLREVLQGKTEAYETILKKIKAVTLEEIQALAKEIVKENELRLAVIGPFKNEEKFKSLLV